MKILCLLLAVFLLVLQGAPEFSQAKNPYLQCRLHGGDCYYKSCLFNAKILGMCGRRSFCCERRFVD